MILRRSILGGGAGLLAAAAAPSLAHADGQVITLPFAMNGDRPVTTCFIGDKGPFLMLIDTGNALMCSLRADILEGLNLRRVGSQRVYGVTGTDVQIAYSAPDVVFGQAVRQKDVVFLAMNTGEPAPQPSPKPAPGAENKTPRHAFDGILPLALLTARPTDLDFTTGELRIQYTGAVDRTGFRPVHSERVRQSQSAFVIRAMVDGVEARLVVDTGANETLSLNPSFVGRHGLWAKHPRFIEETFGGVTGGGGHARLVRSPEVKIGPYLFKDVPISLSDPRMTTLSEIDGLLGIDFIKRFTAGFDAAASTLWLKPNDHLADPFPYDHAGMRLKMDGEAAVVEQVFPESPAAQAGFKPGDRLREIDTPQKLARLEGRFYVGPVGSPMTLAVIRDGQRTPVTITPQEWL